MVRFQSPPPIKFFTYVDHGSSSQTLGAGGLDFLSEAQGELGPFRTFVKQPAQRTRPREQQLRRFLGTERVEQFVQVEDPKLRARRLQMPSSVSGRSKPASSGRFKTSHCFVGLNG